VGGGGCVVQGCGVQVAALVVFRQEFERGVVYIWRAGRGVENECWTRAVGRVGGCFGECEELLVAPGCGFVPALGEREERRMPLCDRADAEERFAGRHCEVGYVDGLQLVC
jgi:hypothetical protein